MKKSITVIDLGSSKIAAATADIDKTGKLSVSALENLESRGINGGEIVDINKAIEDISLIKKKLERKEKNRLKKVYVTTRGADTRLEASGGMIVLSRTPREVTRKDIKKCLKLTSMVRLPVDRAVVQSIVKGFNIDGAPQMVKDPIGLYGIKLEARAFIATANLSKIQNITKCIDHAGMLLEGIYLSSIAVAGGVLKNEEKEKGVLLIDIGESLTEAIVFKNGALTNAHIMQKGARTIVDSHGHANKIKLAELFDEARGTLSAETGDFSSVVLTGGGALLDGVIEEAEKALRVQARVGLVKDASYGLNAQEAIIHAPTFGLIKTIASEYHTSRIPGNRFHKIFHNLLTLYETYF